MVVVVVVELVVVVVVDVWMAIECARDFGRLFGGVERRKVLWAMDGWMDGIGDLHGLRLGGVPCSYGVEALVS